MSCAPRSTTATLVDLIGLGLAITRRALARYGSRVDVTSAPGPGSTFVFDLRLVVPAAGTSLAASTGGGGDMATIEQSIDVDVPVTTAYNQWTQFEEFPKFMEGVKVVRQLDDRHLRWHAEVAGREKEWDADITEQHPDERIAWRSTTGAPNAGVVTFHRLSDARTRIMLQMDYEPEGMTETVGDLLGVLTARVKGDLERFKAFIESRGSETGAWRGDIAAAHQKRGRPAA